MDVFVGTIMSFAFNYAPDGWLPCDGRTLNISDYQLMYAVIGTIYGGDGVTTFGLPDLRGRVPIHTGQASGFANYFMGQKGGAEVVALVQSNMPPHTHSVTVAAGANNAGVISPVTATLNATSAAASVQTAGGSLLGNRAAYASNNSSAAVPTPTAPMASNSLSVTGSLPLPTVAVQNTGVSSPVPILQPYQAINYLIAVQGLYPQHP